jgi:hypothetical protein
VYHVLNADGLSDGDVGLSLLGLALFVVVGGGLVWSAGAIERSTHEPFEVAP